VGLRLVQVLMYNGLGPLMTILFEDASIFEVAWRPAPPSVFPHRPACSPTAPRAHPRMARR
jgi:hypothetical protein